MSTVNHPPFPLTYDDIYTEAEIEIIYMNKVLKESGIPPYQKFDRMAHAQQYNA